MRTPSSFFARNSPGSAMLAAIFVLALVSLLGVALCFLGRTEATMSSNSVRLKQSFYLAEAALENARTTLHVMDTNEDFDDELSNFANDGTFQFDPANLTVTWGIDGTPTALSGFGDDQPVRPLASFGGGWYAAFVTNDPAETVSDDDDGNAKVMVTGVGFGADRSMEVVQAIVERRDVFPTPPPSAITLLGPNPSFDGGNSSAHEFSGDDCGGTGVPGLRVPVVGLVGAAAEAAAETGIHNPDFESGGYYNEDTFADLTDAANEPTLDNDIDSTWLQCQNVHDMVTWMRSFADVLCTAPGPCSIPNPANIADLIVIDGDIDVGPPGGAGTLVVTGELRLDGSADWEGTILVFGEGRMVQNGAGNGDVSGAIMVADVAGPDGIFGNADDCSGGFGNALFDMSGGGNADTEYCQSDILASTPRPPFKIVSFRQH